MTDDIDVIASGGATPVVTAPDLVTAIAALSSALDLATDKSDTAGASAASALDSLFKIKQLWYGSLAGDPALDPNNNNPMNGALYFNKTMGRLMTYNGTAWTAVAGIFLSGSGAPGSGDGANGDFYVQMPAGTLYGPKAGGVWPAGIAIAGVGPVPWTQPAAWATSQNYTVGPPASLVVYNGEAYVCTTTHLSGGAFDPTKWIKVTASAAIPSTSITDSTAFGRALLTAASVAAQRTALGLGTAALLSEGVTGGDLVEAATAADARTVLGLGALATVSQVPISAAPAGTWVLLATLTASNSASLSNTSVFTSTYDEYEIIFENLLPSTNAVDLQLQIHSGGSFRTSGYLSTTAYNASGSFGGVTATAYIDLSAGAGRLSSASNFGLSGDLRMNFVNGTGFKKVWGTTALNDIYTSNGLTVCTVSGMWTGGSGAITGIRVQMSSGNIASGKVYIYGRKK